MKNYSVELTVRQLQEIRNVITGIIAYTDCIHKLSYPELINFQKGYMRLLTTSGSAVFKKQNKNYKFSFDPAQSESFVKLFVANTIPLTPYAVIAVSKFCGQVDKQSQDYRSTFLSQHPIDTPAANHQFSKSFKHREY